MSQVRINSFDNASANQQKRSWPNRNQMQTLPVSDSGDWVAIASVCWSSWSAVRGLGGSD